MEKEVFHRSGNYSFYGNMSENTFTLERKTPGVKREQIDAFCHFWAFGFADLGANNPITVKTQGKEIVGNGKIAMFCPPFSLVHWCLPGVPVTFKLMASSVRLPEGLPEEPCAFTFEEQAFLPVHELLERLKTVKDFLPIGKVEYPSSVARRAREAIVGCYQTQKSIEEIAKNLNVAHSELSRGFRKAYGLTAVAYRNRLRIMHAFWEVLLGRRNIQEIALEAGFQDISRFNKQFAAMMTASPSMFR